MGAVTKAWNRIEDWLRANAPLLSLPIGATPEAICDAEEALGCSMPGSVRESYELHNGSGCLHICDQGYLMPLFKPEDVTKREQRRYKEVVGTTLRMRAMLDDGLFDDPGFVSKPDGPIRSSWWNEKWMPITCNDSGDYLCLDLAPAKGGNKGQVIDWWHEQGATKVVANGIGEWLSLVADSFEADEFTYDVRSKRLKKAKS